ncbi:MAG: YHS domain-containing protein [Thermoplasmata archaeon]
MLRDPVCGMDVDEKSKYKSEYNGKTYYFCSESCKKQFDMEPAKYVKERKRHGC